MTGKTTFDPNRPPTSEEVAKACALTIKDEQEKEITLGQVLGDQADQKVIAIWIRHFYCGLCMDFLSFLSSKINPDMLTAQNVKLVVIGCGDASMIKGYRELLSLQFPVYADPQRRTYTALGMTLRTLEAGKFKTVPEYIGRSALSNIIGSIKSAFRIGKLTASSGDIKQVGGEFVFGPAPGREVLYTHRMENTRGHAPLKLVLQAAGVPYAG